MKTFHSMVAVSLVSAGVLVLGCEHAQDRNVATTTPASSPPGQPATAARAPAGPRPVGVTNTQPRPSPIDGSVVDRLAGARCERELACDNIGGGKKYASREVCLDQLRGSIGNDLNTYECPHGLDENAVQQCLAAIGDEQCGAHPMEAVTRMERCRSGAICLK